MQIDRDRQRLRIRHDARLGLARYLGYLSMFVLLPVSILMGIVNAFAPASITLDCDRAADRCTVSPVSAGWRRVDFEIAELALVHVEHSGRNRIIYLGERGGSPRHQLSNPADGVATGDAYEAAVARAQAFAAAGDPRLSISWPPGTSGMPWIGVVITFVAGLVWTVHFFRIPRHLVIELDGTQRLISIQRAMWRRSDARVVSYAEVAAITTWGHHSRAAMVSVALRLHDGDPLLLLDEGAFAAGKADAELLASALSSELGVPVLGS
jgi:hypothetical protein